MDGMAWHGMVRDGIVRAGIFNFGVVWCLFVGDSHY